MNSRSLSFKIKQELGINSKITLEQIEYCLATEKWMLQNKKYFSLHYIRNINKDDVLAIYNAKYTVLENYGIISPVPNLFERETMRILLSQEIPIIEEELMQYYLEQDELIKANGFFDPALVTGIPIGIVWSIHAVETELLKPVAKVL